MIAALLCACGGAGAGRRSVEGDVAAEQERPTRRGEREGTSEIVEVLVLGAGIARCPPDDEVSCEISGGALWDPEGQRWILLDVDFSEAGPESVDLVAATVSESRFLGGFGGDRESLRGLAQRAQEFARLRPARDIVARFDEAEFSLNVYAPSVGLASPLEGWTLEIRDDGNLDAPVQTLALIRDRDGTRVELARRQAPLGPCDGGGWYCGAGEEECTADGLRAEGRLCIEPMGIGSVALSDDRTIMLVQGTRQVAGHGGYPPFHWVVALPPAVLAE